VYIAEITPKSIRGAFTALNQVKILGHCKTLMVSTQYIAYRPLLDLVAVFDMLWHFVDLLSWNCCFLAYSGFDRYCLSSLLLCFIRFTMGNRITSLSMILSSGCIPCVLQIFGLFFIPESPRWLVSCLWGVPSTQEEPRNMVICVALI